ncbi:MAG: hypothetical protein J2P39_13270, partial [Candidatus Dormibacteraeota bacterium]|nr:hypothetical protein [Candidatus Dormibacteraeota bacterium]
SAAPSPDDSGSVDPSAGPEDSLPPEVPSDGTSGEPTDGTSPGVPDVDPGTGTGQQPDGEVTDGPPTSMGPIEGVPDPEPAY